MAKLSTAAAALILLATLFLFTSPSAKAVTLEQIYEAIVRAKNVYIASFIPDTPGPIQEQWVSRSLGLYMTKTNGEFVLWDLSAGVRKIRDAEVDVTSSEVLSDKDMGRTRTAMDGFFGLVPFDALTLVPEDSEWERVTSMSTTEEQQSLEIYELIWAEQMYGVVAQNKWRVFVDTETNLPVKSEFYQRLPDDDGYVLKSIRFLESMTNGEILAAIEEARL